VRREAADLVPVNIEHMHTTRMRAEREEARVHGQASRRVRLEEARGVGTQPLVLEHRLRLLLLLLDRLLRGLRLLGLRLRV